MEVSNLSFLRNSDVGYGQNHPLTYLSIKA